MQADASAVSRLPLSASVSFLEAPRRVAFQLAWSRGPMPWLDRPLLANWRLPPTRDVMRTVRLFGELPESFQDINFQAAILSDAPGWPAHAERADACRADTPIPHAGKDFESP